ncbi:MAG: 30S ribosomal protein S12 methylthiotransferase RimO [Bacteroidaceae bacterium]|nr:30S ribosomal protein S12 methylthiotransferase RimO [Bacteroidaceae bacterium]
MNQRTVDLITMGCSKNLVDSEKLLYQLEKNGFEVFHNPKNTHGDIAIVNTCGFINDAKEESINIILELCMAKEKGKLNRLFVVGCLSERFFKELNQEIPQVDKYYGKFNYDALLRDLGKTVFKDCSNLRHLTTPHHYAYIKISEGCDRQCAYCAIPIITGAHKSRSMEEIVDEVKLLVGQGVKEFQIIAQELTYYGLDLYRERKIAELIERISDIKGVEWIRLHYAYPNQFPENLLSVMRERDNVCKYLDIALQHISNKVLANMQRHTTKEYQYELIEKLRSEVPGICLRTTLMVGFPGEGDAEFQELMDFTRWARFERMGAFMYSEEEGTDAARKFKDSVSPDVKESRLSDLMDLQEEISSEICETRIGKTLKTIIDRKEGDYYIGRTEYDSPEVDGEVLIKTGGKRLQKGNFYPVTITDANEFDLLGEIKK